MARAARSSRLTSALNGRGASEQGINWLSQAVNPFPDVDVPPTGYPDWSTDASIVACVEKTVSISCPASISTGTWDCNIFSLPLLAGTVTSSTSGTPQWSVANETSPTVAPPTFYQFNPGAMQGLNSTMDFSTVNYCIQPTGSNTLPAVGTANFAPSAFGWLDAGQTWTNGNSRLVALGFEVANTTADLNKQGAVAYYRCPQASQDSYLLSHPSATLAIPLLVRHYRYPPVNVGEAMLLRGTVVREAQDGAYVPVTMCSSDNDFKTRRGMPLSFRYGDIEGAPIITNIPTVSSTTGQFGDDCSIEEAPFDTCGAYFTGLSLSTTLQLTVRFYVEKVPAPYDSALVVLTRPAPPMDPVALEIYKRIIADLPPGTALADNASGDWWKTICNIVSTAAPILGAVAAPFTGGASLAIGSGIGTAAKGLSQIGGKPQPTTSHMVVSRTPTNTTPEAARAVATRLARQPVLARSGPKIVRSMKK